MSGPATFCGMYATALDLPPETVTRIVELLAGDCPETWEAGWKNFCPPLKLSKREFGNCSLVCKYWAQLLRQHIFKRLTLNTPEDGRIFRSFIDQSVCPQSSIKNLVRRLDIKYDLADPPWVQHVFMFCIPKLRLNYNPFNVEMSDSSKTPSSLPLRSIYPFLPCPLPPRITNISTLCLRNLEFANFQDLGKLIGSVGTLNKVELKNVLVKDTESLYSCRRIPPRTQHWLDIVVYGGNISLRLLRLLLPVGDRRRNAHVDIPPGVIQTFEQAILSIIRAEKPGSTNRDDILEFWKFSVSYEELIFSDPGFCYGVSVKWFTQEHDRDSPIHGVQAYLHKTGFELVLQFCEIVDIRQINSVRWAQLDKDLSNLDSIILEIDEGFEHLDKLTKLLSREMTICVEAGKLLIRIYLKEYRVRPHKGEDDDEDDEEDNEEDDDEDEDDEDEDDEDDEEDVDEEDNEEAEVERERKPAYRDKTRETNDHGQFV